MKKIADPRVVLESYYRLGCERSGAASTMGPMLARARMFSAEGPRSGTYIPCRDDSGPARVAYRSDESSVAFADVALMCSDLSPLEREVCRLRYWYVEAGTYDPLTQRGGYETYTRNVHESEVRPTAITESGSDAPVLMTIALEEQIGTSHETTLTAGYAEDGTFSTASSSTAVEHRVVVRGTRTRLTSYDAIAEVTERSDWTFGPMTVRQIRSVLARAMDKVRLRIERLEVTMTTLDGLKSIAHLLEQIWRRPVSHFAVWRYIRSPRDPLPATTIRTRVQAEREALLVWAKRQAGRQ